MFLERAYEGRYDIGRWIAMLVIVIIVTQLVGKIPVEIMIFLKMSDNPDLEPNPENPLDLSAYDISPITGLVLMIVPLVLGLITLLVLMKPIHERSLLSVITGHRSFRWKNFLWGAGVWFILLTIYAVFAAMTEIRKIELQFNPVTLLTLTIVSILLLPFQTGFEEVFFRGYLMQGFSQLFKYKWLTLLLISFIFGGLHFLNPEVEEYGAGIVLSQYFLFGIFFGICVLMDEGLELAWGVHSINNIFLSVFFTRDSSAFQIPALYRITAFNPLFDLIGLFTLSVLFIFIARQYFQWPDWHYLLAKIEKPVSKEEIITGYFEDEYDEYNEQ